MSAASRPVPSHSGSEPVAWRPLAASWLALLLLMLASLGASYLHLGGANLVVGLVIAVVKTAIVAWWFMALRTASPSTRLAAAMALFFLAVLLTLTGVDYRTRVEEPVLVQPPQQIEPIVPADKHPR